MEWERFLKYVKEWKGEVCIFGAGKCGSSWCYKLIKEAGLNLRCYIDNNIIHKNCNGYPVYQPSYLENNKDTLCMIAVMGESAKEIERQILELGIKEYFTFPEWESCFKDLPEVIDKLGDPIINRKLSFIADDSEYLKRRFKERMGSELNLSKPETFNEKLQWLKIHDRKNIYSTMVDKYEVKKYVANRIGKEYIVPTIGVYGNFDEIDFGKLPQRFVLKCTHDSGSVLFCRDKNIFDIENARRKLELALSRNTFWPDREWPYYNVPKRIICEELLGGEKTSVDVYKVFNFNGKAELIQVIQDDKTEKESIDYFDLNWELLDLRQNFPNSKRHLERPKQLNKMIDLAECLSVGHPFLRTDFYIVDDKIWFSEFTFFSDSGAERFYPEEWDIRLGRLIKLNLAL